MCLSMKVHMYGSSIDTLKVIRISGGSGQEAELFKKTGNQGNKWSRVNVDLPVGGPYEVWVKHNRPFSYSTKSLDRAIFLRNFIREAP